MFWFLFSLKLVGSQHEELRPWQKSRWRRLSIRKGGIEPQESPWKFSSIYPQNQSLPTLLLCALTYTSDFTGGCPLSPLSERVNLQLQLIKFLGVPRVFQPTNSFGSPLACLSRFFQPHVIVQRLPTVRGMRCSKLSKYRFLWDKGPFSGRHGLPGPASLEPGADIQSTALLKAVWPWARAELCLCPSFLIWKMREIIVPLS